MKIAIHPEKIEDSTYAKKWSGFLEKKNIEVKWVDLTSTDALEQVAGCDGVMWRWIHTPQDKIKAFNIIYAIEHYLKIPFFPNIETCWHYDNKVSQYYLLQSANVSIPKTWVFWDKKRAIEWAKTTDYPKVFKLSSGAGSSNVLKVNSGEEALGLIDKMFCKGIFPMTMNEYKKSFFPPKNKREFRSMLSRIKQGLVFGFFSEYPPLPKSWWIPEKDYAYFQEFMPNNSYDTRITVIGNRAFGFRRYNREGDFRASGSGKIGYDATKVDLEIVKIAFQASALLQCQSMAYDFLYKNNRPVIIEVTYTFVDEAVYNCQGHWKPNLSWVTGNMWPEEAQVNDFVQHISMLKEN